MYRYDIQLTIIYLFKTSLAAQCQPGPAGCQASGGAENQQDSGQTEDHGIVKLQGTFKEKNTGNFYGRVYVFL